MTESYLAQLEVQIERLLTHTDNLEESNLQLQNRVASANQAEQDRRAEYQQLMTRYDELDKKFQDMSAKELRARSSEQQALQEKSKLAQLNDRTKSHIEKMISRLKALEQNS
ncbi:MAG: hypothetical protein OFPII_19700 [Osedax symbiont Rs1]|nr:MAG: hypothetical protein OFPII_19700 [Osedax symbiont Rs1]